MNANSFFQDSRERRHRLLRERLGATCPHCKSDILDALLEGAYDWGGYGEPSSVAFECPACEVEIKFNLEWETTLRSAALVEEMTE